MLFQRMLRAAKLDVSLYEEVEHDKSASLQAALVVLIATLLPAIGSILLHFNALHLAWMIVAYMLGWITFAFLTYIIGTKVFGGQADTGEMLRTLGFATTPMCLGIIPIVGAFIGGVWTIVTTVIAIRQGADISTGKAIVTAILSVVAYIVIESLLGRLLIPVV